MVNLFIENRGKGAGLAFLRGLIGHRGKDCVTWPMCRDPLTGYGRVGAAGIMKPGTKARIEYAHRVMCFLAHGPAPTEAHEVAHSCGNGRGGCVNPNHLSWKTRSENQLDRRRHGTATTNPGGSHSKLTEQQKQEIRALKGSETQMVLAERYGVHYETISRIQRTSPRARKITPLLSPEQVRKIRSLHGTCTQAKIAAEVGCGPGAVSGVVLGKYYTDIR